MTTLTFQLEDHKAVQLAVAAHKLGLTVGGLLRRLVDDFLSRREGDEAAMYVLTKNAELYRRLASAPNHVVGESS